MELQQLDMAPGSSNHVVTGTESNIDGVDTQKIDNHKVFVNRTGARTRRLAVTKLNHQAQFLQGGVVIKGACPVLNEMNTSIKRPEYPETHLNAMKRQETVTINHALLTVVDLVMARGF